MSFRRVSYDVGVMLGALRVPFTTTSLIKNRTVQYIIDDFGVVVSVINRADYGIVDERIEEALKGHRKIFVTEGDNLDEKRYEVLWALMRSGYMKWLRMTYSSQFPTLLETGNLGNLIIDERLFIWDNKPKYKFLIQDNLEAKKMGYRQILSRDPSFFDYMP